MGHEPFFQPWAHGIFKDRYAFSPDEDWFGCADRVSRNVVGSLYGTPRGESNLKSILAAEERIKGLIAARDFIPGGRYLYASARDLHQTQNCLLLRAEDTREGWAELAHNSAMALMTGAGIGVYYGDIRPAGAAIQRTGGVASGPLSLMYAINEWGRNTMQGGMRRSAIWAGLPWWHADVFAFIRAKDWPQWLRDQKAADFNTHAPLDMTNISVCLDAQFFEAYADDEHPRHGLAHEVYQKTLDKALTTGEPGFSIDNGTDEVLRNACTEITSADDSDVCLARGTRVLTSDGYKLIEEVKTGDQVLTGSKAWRSVLRAWSNGVRASMRVTVRGGRSLQLTPNHRVLTDAGWVEAGSLTIGSNVAVNAYEPASRSASKLSLEYFSLGWGLGDGWFTERPGFGFVFGPEDSSIKEALVPYLRERLGGGSEQTQPNGVHMLRFDSTVTKRLYGARYGITPSVATGKRVPAAVWTASVRERRSFLAGLFAADGSAKTTRRNVVLASSSKAILRDVQLLLDQEGIMSWTGWYSVPGRNDQGVLAVNGSSLFRFVEEIGFGLHSEKQALSEAKVASRRRSPASHPAYLPVVKIAADDDVEVFDISLAGDEHSFVAEGVVVHNCNLGSVNLGHFNDIDQFEAATRDATLFLLAGTVYSDLPYAKVHRVREKNRRLGLGLMGLHEWLLKRGKPYGPDPELARWLAVWQRASDEAAREWADRLGLSRPVAIRAIAPNGTTGIIGETTAGIECILYAASRRRIRQAGVSGPDRYQYEYIVDPTAARLLADGLDPELIEDSVSLRPEQRFEFQAFVQAFVDQAISSTVNLPRTITDPSDQAALGRTLMKYLPDLRGVTMYPDGCRPGQPYERVTLDEALSQVGVRFEEAEERCLNGICGI